MIRKDHAKKNPFKNGALGRIDDYWLERLQENSKKNYDRRKFKSLGDKDERKRNI